MVSRLESGKEKSYGFTLLELAIVLLILGLLSALASPVFHRSVTSGQEAVLKKNLHVTRLSLEDYYADNGFYPSSLGVLVDEKYLRSLPFDTVLNSDDEWVLEEGDEGVYDLISGSDGVARDGSYYADW